MRILSDRCKVVQVDINSVLPNPAQPRRIFSEKELLELSRSIRTNGLLQPITVRHVKNGYELIVGERRLRASKIAGLETISCIIKDCTPEKSAILAMTENLQRQDLQIFEEAEGIRQLIEQWHVTQEEAAYRLGKSQSTLANKLRILRLSINERQKITENHLTERHARSLLRIKDEQLRDKLLDQIIEKQLNVQQSEELINKFLLEKQKPKQKRTIIVKDVRVFFNTINHAIDTMKNSGINAKSLNSETDEYFECIVRIPKAQATKNGKKPA